MDPNNVASADTDATQATIAVQAAAAIQGNHNVDPAVSSSNTATAQNASVDAPLQTIQSSTSHTSALPKMPPMYGDHYGKVQGGQDGLGTEASVGEDGRVNIKISQSNDKLIKVFGPALHQQELAIEHEAVPPTIYIPPSLGGDEDVPPPPPMNVVIQVVGSRGDVQPFIALGKTLKETYSHRVRLATHPNFQGFVEENGLEFFSIGGDPAELMAFMVKHPGLMPDFDALRTGDIGKRRKEVGEYIKGCWRSCFETGNGLGVEVSDDLIQDWSADQGDAAQDMAKPFVADCIIANPPSFAHVHCAERLGIPLHVMFTMPYSPTQAFPHPLANIQSSNADPHLTNYISYALIEMLTWQGLGDIINRFRAKSLGLEPISLVRAPGMLQRLQIPHTYCWSPALIPKPADWSQRISISGFYFLNLATNYHPPSDLTDFLKSGPPPVYIGFGSIVLEEPNVMTNLIFETVRKTGQRVLLSKGWGGMGAEEMDKPDGVFMLGNCPHDWLFKQVSCVVHHGGAGTTAAGITAGRPTVVVPFFGDQPFWGAMVARAGAGPEPIPHKQLTSDNLAGAIEFCLKPESQERAQELALKIVSEKGTDEGALSFHQFLEVDKLRCNIAPSRVAVWRLKRTQIRLSAMAACTLAQANLLSFEDLKLFRAKEYETDEGPWDPISGGATAVVGTMSTMMLGVADLPIETLKALRIHPDSVKDKNKGKQVRNDKESDVNTVFSNQGASSSGLSINASAPNSSGSQSPVASEATTPKVLHDTASTFSFQESFARVGSPLGTNSEERSSRKGPTSSSMADALRGNLVRANSQSSPRSRSSSRTRPKDFEGLVDTALGTGKGVSRIVGAGFSSPLDFTMSVSRGFHNAPKLYGDDTVRKHDQVTDFKSGIRAAGKEFGLGMYDGISGLVTHPLRGARKEGAAGFIKGIGKGIGGVALKPSAAVFSLPAYAMKGVQKEIQQYFGTSVQNYIIASRTAQGYAEWRSSSEEEKHEIIARWKGMQGDIKKKRNPDEMVRDILEEQRRKQAERLAAHRQRGCSISRSFSRRGSRASKAPATPAPPVIISESSASSAAERHVVESIGEEEEADLDEAIRRSVQETSRGNAEEDAQVEQAIQASIADLQRQRQEQASPIADGEEADLQQAIEASRADNVENFLFDAEFERVLTQSLKEQRRNHGDSGVWDFSENDTDLTPSAKEHAHVLSNSDVPGYDEGSGSSAHIDGETREHFDSQPKRDEKTTQEKMEEQIVLEYIKKQSLAEEEHRQRALGG